MRLLTLILLGGVRASERERLEDQGGVREITAGNLARAQVVSVCETYTAMLTKELMEHQARDGALTKQP